MQLNHTITSIPHISEIFESQGFCLVDPFNFSQLVNLSVSELESFSPSWNNLKQDNFLKDLGKYRLRRHSSYIVEGDGVILQEHRPHWQSIDYNALHGGLQRMFEPIEPLLNNSENWSKLILGVSKAVPNKNKWFTEAHQFRINTIDGIGRPTPEGAHRDGVDYVAVILIKRNNIIGGETRIFQIDGNEGLRFTLSDPWTMLLIDDKKIIHETTPIQDRTGVGYRDTLVLTYKLDGFQNPIS